MGHPIRLVTTFYTIGHSTRSIEELIEALRAHGIWILVDIRAFPQSRRLPQFNREALEASLRKGGLGYVWRKELGGYRKKMLENSPNIALCNESFRNYADYMLTPEFEWAAQELIRLAEQEATAYMCAERVFLHCHRMLVSDWLVAHGHEVRHIDDAGPVKVHVMSADARVSEGRVIYRGDRLF